MSCICCSRSTATAAAASSAAEASGGGEGSCLGRASSKKSIFSMRPAVLAYGRASTARRRETLWSASNAVSVGLAVRCAARTLFCLRQGRPIFGCHFSEGELRGRDLVHARSRDSRELEGKAHAGIIAHPQRRGPTRRTPRLFHLRQYSLVHCSNVWLELARQQPLNITSHYNSMP
jgi:hypothetical protein